MGRLDNTPNGFVMIKRDEDLLLKQLAGIMCIPVGCYVVHG